MLLTIVTPTILRDSLVRTCHSIDEQSFGNWRHLIMVDDMMGIFPAWHLNDSRRTFIRCPRKHANFGNSCRNQAFDLVTGPWISFLDDDDMLMPGALGTISAAITVHQPDWVLFPALVRGDRWLNVPPGKGRTVSCQFAYRKDLGIRWPDTPEYSADGDLIDQLYEVGAPYVIQGEPLVVVTESRYGAA